MNWQAFELENLIRRQATGSKSFLQFLDQPSISMELYVLNAGETDEQKPHELDEVYYVLAGKATLRVAEDDLPVQPGSIVYVKARVEHRFYDITEDLQVLVVFPKR